MKILLINPYLPYPYTKGEHTYNRIWPPLSLANCAAILKKENFDVTLLDAHALRIPPKKLSKYLKNFTKIFITSSTLDRWLCPNINIDIFLEQTSIIKKTTNEFYVIGYHGTKSPEEILNKTQAKAVILKEPEYTVLDIAKNINLDTIAGIAYKKNNKTTIHSNCTNVNLKELPIPAYALIKSKNYFYEIMGKNFYLFEISRGCKYNCKFCSKLMYGDTYRVKTYEQITKEISTAVEKHNVKTGYFIDLDFLSNKDLVLKICDYLSNKKYDFTWCCQTRPDSVDLSILTNLKNAGCQLIHFGVESGLQKNRKLINKDMPIEKIIENANICQELNIKTLAFYLFGFKNETKEERESTFKFAKELNTDFISFHKIFPYEKDDIYLNNLETNKEIDIFIRKKIFSYYMRINYLRNLNFFTALKCFKLFIGRLTSLFT